MEFLSLLVVTLGVLAVALAAGQWIAFALIVTALVLLVANGDGERIGALGSIAWNSINDFILVAIPLFILMGEIILRGELSERFYASVLVLFRRVPGALLHSNTVASALFSAISGSSLATVATVGTVAFPAMEKAQYSRKLGFGSLAAGGMLGQLIPPSIGALVYASQVQVSVSKLFIAGVLPGLTLAALVTAYLVFRVARDPSLAPRNFQPGRAGTVLSAILGFLPLLMLMGLVLGAIYLGVATPTEAAALGATAAVILTALFGSLSRMAFAYSIKRTVSLSAMLLFLIIGAQVLSYALVQTGLTRSVVQAVTDIGPSPFAFYLVLLVMYGVLGMFIEGLSIMLLTLPVVFPVISALGYDPIWFGVVMILYIEMGLITPPLGTSLFVLQGIARGTPLAEVARASFPVLVCMIITLLLLYCFPWLATWLPTFVG